MDIALENRLEAFDEVLAGEDPSPFLFDMLRLGWSRADFSGRIDAHVGILSGNFHFCMQRVKVKCLQHGLGAVGGQVNDYILDMAEKKKKADARDEDETDSDDDSAAQVMDLGIDLDAKKKWEWVVCNQIAVAVGKCMKHHKWGASAFKYVTHEQLSWYLLELSTGVHNQTVSSSRLKAMWTWQKEQKALRVDQQLDMRKDLFDRLLGEKVRRSVQDFCAEHAGSDGEDDGSEHGDVGDEAADAVMVVPVVADAGAVDIERGDVGDHGGDAEVVVSVPVSPVGVTNDDDDVGVDASLSADNVSSLVNVAAGHRRSKRRRVTGADNAAAELDDAGVAAVGAGEKDLVEMIRARVSNKIQALGTTPGGPDMTPMSVCDNSNGYAPLRRSSRRTRARDDTKTTSGDKPPPTSE